MRERLLELKNTFPSFFNNLVQENLRMYYETNQIKLLDILEEDEIGYRSLALFEKSAILIPYKITEEPIYFNFFFGRELTNNKYYKNIVQFVWNNYVYLQFKDEKDMKELMKVLNQKIKQQN